MSSEWSYPSGFLTKILCAFLISSMLARYPFLRHGEDCACQSMLSSMVRFEISKGGGTEGGPHILRLVLSPYQQT